MDSLEARFNFARVDSSGDPASFVRYLDTTTGLEFFKVLKSGTYELVGAQEGAHILDAGCGTGDDVLAMARRVGENGLAAGVDNSEIMLTEARQRSEGLNLPVEFHLAEVYELPFPDATFDGCRAERLFVHLEEPQRALAEMVRVCRPGGNIVVLDSDWETVTIDASDRALTRKIVNLLCDRHANGWIGRQLSRLFKEAGLLDVRVHLGTAAITDYELAAKLLRLHQVLEWALEAGHLSSDEVDGWLAELEERNRAGTFFYSHTGVVIRGMKP